MRIQGAKLRSIAKELIKKSNLVQLSIMKNNQVLLSIPVSLSMLILYFYPLLSTLSTVYFIKNEYTIRIVKVT